MLLHENGAADSALLLGEWAYWGAAASHSAWGTGALQPLLHWGVIRGKPLQSHTLQMQSGMLGLGALITLWASWSLSLCHLTCCLCWMY